MIRIAELKTVSRIGLNIGTREPKNKVMNFKRNLRLILAEKDMSATQLSRLASVPKATLSDWLSGSSPKNIKQLKQVADVFGITIDELVFGPNEKASAPKSPLAGFENEIQAGVFEVVLRPVKKKEFSK